MPGKFKNKYRIDSTRLQHWDYGWNGIYYITICTKDRKHFFGEIENAQMVFSDIGRLAEKFWLEIPQHFSFAILDEFIIMPDHIHGIIKIKKEKEEFEEKLTGKDRCRNPGKKNISSIIGSFKSVVTKHAHAIEKNFGWQSRFHDSIIRDNQGLERVRRYIIDNPKNWGKSK